ncbi:MAG: hypothetical protein ACYDAN_09385 [Candidatus Limnocylindrales bacterium]
MIGYARPMYIGNLVQFLNYRLDIFREVAFPSLRELGLYALGVTLGQLLWIVSDSAASVLLPRVVIYLPVGTDGPKVAVLVA